MKFKFYILFSILFAFAIQASAQDQRTMETRVADALNDLPADNMEEYQSIIEDLLNIGVEVVPELADLYQADTAGEHSVKIEYAFSGMGKYLSASSSDVRGLFSDAFVEAIKDNKFSPLAIDLLEELTYFMPEEKLATLKPLLEERDLQMRVLDILELYPGKESGDILWSAMSKADNRSRFKIYKILSDERFGKSNQVLNPRLADSETEMGRLVLKGMAESGDPGFEEYFMEIAEGEPNSVAIDEIVRYGASLKQKGNEAEARDFLNKIFHNEDLNPGLRALAVKKLAEVDPAGSAEAVKLAFNAENPRINMAAAHALQYLAQNQYGSLTAAVNQTSPAALASSIRTLTRSGWSGSARVAETNLNHADTLVRAQAVIGFAEVKRTDAQSRILGFLKENEAPYVMEAGIQALKMATDSKNTEALFGILDEIDSTGRTMVISVIGARGGQNQFAKMMDIARSSDGEVQAEAIRAAGKLGTDKNIEEILSFLESQEKNIEVTQKTLDEMMTRAGSQNWRPSLLTALNGAETSKFIPLIGHLSSDKSAELSKDILENADENTKNLLLSNIGEWADGEMIRSIIPLLDNADTYRTAFTAALGTIERAGWESERKILYLQKLYDKAKYPMDRQIVIEKIGGHRNMYALLTLADYFELEKDQVKNTTALAIMNVVMPGPQNDDGLTDPLALKWLEEAGEVVTGNDAVYFKENIKTYLNSVSSDKGQGFTSMFNGEDLDGWHGFVANPLQLERMSEKEIQNKLDEANQRMKEHWWVEDGLIRFQGEGQNLVSDKTYKNFVMLVDWRIGDKGDSGIYLRGTPQVQIWDISRTDVGAQVGSGGLYNNQENPSDPLKVSDMPIGEWNHMKISMMDDRVTVWLNGDLVVNNVILENYWDRSLPIFSEGPIELQAHGTDIAFRNLYVKELPSASDLLTAEEKKEGFTPIFNGINLDGWTGNKTQYYVENGEIVVDPDAKGTSGNLYTEKEYENFRIKFEFMLTPGANNGLGVHAPLEGDAAYAGKEFQILDDTAPIYANLKPYQYHGSLYGIEAAEKGHLKPVGEWNSQEIIIDGNQYQVILNGKTILDIPNIKRLTRRGTADGKDHPGLKRTKGHIGFLGHGSEVRFRNLRVKEL